MDLQNLSYAAVQVVHNFGAMAVVGGPLCALALGSQQSTLFRRLGWITWIGWAAQALSGAAFGAVSWLYYGQFPDIHGIAIVALLIKMACAFTGLVLTSASLYRGTHWNAHAQRLSWFTLAVLGVTALTSAAFLRWFS